MKLYTFEITDEKVKSVVDFLTESSPDGLSKSVHKGWLVVTKIAFSKIYTMLYVKNYPLTLDCVRQMVAYCPYPNNTRENITYAKDFDKILADIYSLPLNPKRIKAYRKLAKDFNVDESVIRETFSKGAEWYKNELEEMEFINYYSKL